MERFQEDMSRYWLSRSGPMFTRWVTVAANGVDRASGRSSTRVVVRSGRQIACVTGRRRAWERLRRGGGGVFDGREDRLVASGVHRRRARQFVDALRHGIYGAIYGTPARATDGL